MQSLGNHELDELVDGLVPFIKNISTPVVAANLILDEVPQLKDVENLQHSAILAKNGIKIGVIGYLTPDTAFLAPKNKIIYEDEIPAIRREVQKLKNLGVDILIALGHSGYIKDVEIAKNVEGLDLIIGGHSNTFLWNGENNEKPEIPQGPYPVVVNDPSGRKVLVVQAYAYTKYMGSLHLTFDSKGEVIEFGGSPILLDNSIPKDPELLDIVETYRKDVNRISNEVVGVSDVFLNGDCRLRECNMGNFITDVLLNCSAGQYPEVTITICQSGRIRASIDALEKPFNLTKGEWMGVLPFTDTMTIVTMNGSVLRMVLEHSVAVWRPIDSVGQFLQFSGMTVVYDLLRPAGSRIVEAYAACPKCGDKLSAIKDNYEYKVMMPSFLAEGGDGYSIFVGLPQEHCNYNEITCIYEYLEKYPTISPKLTGRIKLLNEEKAVAIFKVDNTRIDSRLPSNSPSLQSSNYGKSIIYLSVLSCILISRIYV